MKNRDNEINNPATASVLERLAQSILVAHAWVAGPALSERERILPGTGQGRKHRTHGRRHNRLATADKR